MNVWCNPAFLFNQHRFYPAESTEWTTLPAGRGCWITSWTSEPAVRQAESGNKAPYCPPLLALKDGINWPDKRYQRKVLLRVLEFNRPLYGSRAQNRKVPSAIKAGLRALTAANDSVLIIRGVDSTPCNLFKNQSKFCKFHTKISFRFCFPFGWATRPSFYLIIHIVDQSSGPQPFTFNAGNRKPPQYL